MQKLFYASHMYVQTTSWHLAVDTAQLGGQANCLVEMCIYQRRFSIFEFSQTQLHGLSLDGCPN